MSPRPRRGRAAAPQRRDASMTLLLEVMQRPLDPGYAAAAQRREREPGRRSRGAVTTVLLAAVAGSVLVGAVTALRPSVDDDSMQLLSEQIDDRTTGVEQLEEQVVDLQGRVDQAQADVLAGAADGLVDQAQLLALVTGAGAVVGPGLQVELDDAVELDDLAAADPRAREQAEQGRVRDRDLQIVVNGLWASGAEAVAVNDQRLTSMTSIRTAGSAVLVNFRPLVPPYLVEAVGPPGLEVAFTGSAAGRYLTSLQQNYGVRTSVSASEGLELPGAPGLRLRAARTADAPTTPTTPPTTPATEDS